jgi:hypothetical protein
MGSRDRDGSPPVTWKTLAKDGLRRYGVATAGVRTLPDFLIIGAKRAATTSLWNYVVNHPNTMPMFPSRLHLKGTGFFSVNFEKGVPWYRSHIPAEAARRLRERRDRVRPSVGEATPYYLFHPRTPPRVRRVLPQAKLIVILRNPTDRAYSHYRERVRNGVEALSFEQALDAEDERLDGEEERILADGRYHSLAHEHLSYVRQGRYADMLARWFSCFDRERFLVILNEEFDRHRDRELGRVWDFLGLPSWAPPDMKRYNYHRGEPMRAATRERLVETFRPGNHRLQTLLGTDLRMWDE